jgi:hypothetical protein
MARMCWKGYYGMWSEERDRHAQGSTEDGCSWEPSNLWKHGKKEVKTMMMMMSKECTCKYWGCFQKLIVVKDLLESVEVVFWHLSARDDELNERLLSRLLNDVRRSGRGKEDGREVGVRQLIVHLHDRTHHQTIETNTWSQNLQYLFIVLPHYYIIFNSLIEQ